MEAAEAAKRTMPEAVLSDAYLVQFFEAFYSIDLHVLIRFGKWDDILSRDIPTNKKVRIQNIIYNNKHFSTYHLTCILSLSLPPSLSLLFSVQLYPYTICMTRYARGIALAVTHRPLEARAELELLRAASVDVPASFVLHNNTCSDMLRIADAMLVGEIEYREGG